MVPTFAAGNSVSKADCEIGIMKGLDRLIVDRGIEKRENISLSREKIEGAKQISLQYSDENLGYLKFELGVNSLVLKKYGADNKIQQSIYASGKNFSTNIFAEDAIISVLCEMK